MSKTITIKNPEFQKGLDAINQYFAEVCGYKYRKKRVRTPQEKGKRNFRWGHWQKELKWMNEYLDFTIEPSISKEEDIRGCKINLTLTDKATGEKTVLENLNCVGAHNQMYEYRREARKKRV